MPLYGLYRAKGDGDRQRERERERDIIMKSRWIGDKGWEKVSEP